MNVCLICYDNGSHIPFFPQNIAYLAGALRQEGHDVSLWLQDISHATDDSLTAFLDGGSFDLVGLGFVAGYFQYVKALNLSRAINRSRNRKNFLYVLGGHGPAAEPEYFKEKMQADMVVIGEGEFPLLHILESPYYFAVPGILLNDNPQEDPDDYAWPDYESFPIEIYRLHRFPGSRSTDFTMPILSGRGCKWNCTFCYRMDPGFRPRDPKAVIEEMRYLYRKWRINHFQFSDELFMSSKTRVHAFCEELLHQGVQKWWKWDCNGRLNYADTETLEIMKRAGCNYINYGCESLSQEALNKMKKGLTVSQIHRGVENTKALDIKMGLNFIWPLPGDSYESLEKAVAFLKKYDGIAELRTIRPPSPYPGSHLYRDAVSDGLLEGVSDFYQKKHTNSDLLTGSCCYLPSASEWEVHSALARANTELVTAYHTRCSVATNKAALRFYGGLTDPEEFRGFRPI